MKPRRPHIIATGAAFTALVVMLGAMFAGRGEGTGSGTLAGQVASAGSASPSLSSRPEGLQLAPITIDYPEQGSIFPPEITAPTFLWRDAAEDTRVWLIDVAFTDGSAGIKLKSRGDRLRLGEVDPRCLSTTNELPKLTPQQAAARTLTLDVATWEAIKKHSTEHPATVTITGFRDEHLEHPVSGGQVVIQTSKDPVGAPIFYRDVPLMPSELQKGIIKPLPPAAIPLIAWRLRNVGEPRSRLLLDNMHTCANCHSFSLDGKTLGMDLDGPANDKGLYAIARVQPQMSIRTENVISWSSLRDETPSQARIGFMSQVSPDGRYVVTTIRGLEREIENSYYVVNFKDYRFLQVFYPTRGVLAWYDRTTGQRQLLPGADDPRYVQTDAVWSPDGKYLVFARAEAKEPYLQGQELAEQANDPKETPIQYDLYRIPFNAGKGGQPEPIAGASKNGMSNTFPKVSPDGRWIVFVKCRNGQLMRPDSQLYIVSAKGGQARRMQCNTRLMNSWHSFSPNGRWLVFSSKSRSPYTQMFLTHLDEAGNDSPAILIENATAANRAVNIPEFVNIPPDGLLKIEVPAAESYRLFDRAYELTSAGQDEAAIEEWKKTLELDPQSAKAHNNLGSVLLRQGRFDEALTHFEEALQIDSAYGDAHNNLGVTLLRRGRFDEALPQLQEALEINPTYARTYAAMDSDFRSLVGVPQITSSARDSRGLTSTGKNAKKSEQKLEELNAQCRRNLDVLIAYLVAAPEPAHRQAWMQPAEEPQPSNPAGLGRDISRPSNHASNIDEPSSERLVIERLIANLDIPRLRRPVERKQDTEEGIAAERQILRIFLRTLETGNALLEQNRNAQASTCFDIAARAAPNNPYIFYDLAKALALNNQKKEALRTLQKAVEKGFDNFDQLEGDRAFQHLRDNSDYGKAVATIRARKRQSDGGP